MASYPSVFPLDLSATGSCAVGVLSTIEFSNPFYIPLSATSQLWLWPCLKDKVKRRFTRSSKLLKPAFSHHFTNPRFTGLRPQG